MAAKNKIHMKIIGIILIAIGFLDFGFYLLSLVADIHINFMPQLLVFGSKDYTDVAVIILGYFFKGIGEKVDGNSGAATENENP